MTQEVTSLDILGGVWNVNKKPPRQPTQASITELKLIDSNSSEA
jgi:hypothetical protein